MVCCVICQGAEVVRLPVCHPVSAYAPVGRSAIDKFSVSEAYRTYICPECGGGQAGEEKVTTIFAEAVVSATWADNPAALEAVKRNLAKVTAEHFLRDGLIAFRTERRGDEILLRSKLGAVAPAMVTRLERRVLDKLREHLGNIRDAAAERIYIWGSQYTGRDGPVPKDMAVRFVDEAFASEMEKERAGF